MTGDAMIRTLVPIASAREVRNAPKVPASTVAQRTSAATTAEPSDQLECQRAGRRRRCRPGSLRARPRGPVARSILRSAALTSGISTGDMLSSVDAEPRQQHRAGGITGQLAADPDPAARCRRTVDGRLDQAAARRAGARRQSGKA